MALRLKAVQLYTQDLKTKLYTFPGIAPEPEPYLTSVIPAKLEVPSPAPLDAILLDLKYIEALGDKTPDAVYAALWQLIATRDQAFYYRPDRWAGLAPNDARRPFFPRGGGERTQSAMAAFQKWVKAYAAGLPATAVAEAGIGSEQQDGSRMVEALQGGKVGAEIYGKFLSESHLQADQLVSIDSANFPSLNIGGVAVPILFAIPNRWSLYTFKISKQVFHQAMQSVSTFKLGAARLASDANIYGQTVLVIDLTPLSTKVSAGNETLAKQTYDDIPPLSGLAFTAPSPEAAVPSDHAALSLNSAVLDLLAAKVLGNQLSPRALSYVVERRWLSEQKGVMPGGRFFTLGKRQPTPEEAASLAANFIDWAREHAPSFPARVTISSRVEIGNNQTSAPWRAIPCFGMDLRGLGMELFPSFQSQVFNYSRQKEFAAGGSGTWSEQDELNLVALNTVSTAFKSFYMGGAWGGPCGVEGPRLSFLDPAFFTLIIPHALPAPSVSALAGKQELDLKVTLDVHSVSLSKRPPSFADLLPPELSKVLPQSPGPAPTGEFVTFDTNLVEARWNEPNGKDVAQFAADQGDSLNNVLKRVQQKRAELLTAAAPPSGQYGPDLVGVRLGMSFKEAEAIIRQHMQVGHVYEGMRATDPKARAGYPKPFTSGKLFVSGDGREMIALIDEPPAAPGKVLAAWRRVLVESGTIPPEETLSALRAKYGPPSGVPTMHTGSPMSWYEPRGAHCAGYYAYGGTTSLSDFWTDNGAPVVFPGASPYQQANAPMTPEPLLDPLGEQSQQARECGPVLTAYYLQAGQRGGGSDTIDTMVSDVDAYRAAYVLSRKMLQSAPPAPMSLFQGPYGPDVVGVRLGMTLAEAQSVVGQHMKVGDVFRIVGSSEPIGAARLPGSGFLFVSEGNDEVVAIFDAPHPGEGHVAAVWRRVYSPQAVDLALVTRRAMEKYGTPTSQGDSGRLLVWGSGPPTVCGASDAQIFEARTPVEAHGLGAAAAAFQFHAIDGETTLTAPMINAPASPVGLASVSENVCGPRLRVDFQPDQGDPPMNVTGIMLTDPSLASRVSQVLHVAAPRAAVKF